MFCVNCGKEIGNEFGFCPHCGQKNITNNHIQSVNSSLNTSNNSGGVFNKDILNQYLYNVQVLEFAKNRLERKKNDLISQINRLGRESIIRVPCLDTENILWTDLAMMIGGLVVALGFNWLWKVTLGKWISGNFVPILLYVIGGGAFVLGLILLLSEIKDYAKEKKQYRNNLKEDKLRIENELIYQKQLSEELPKLEEEYQKIIDLRNEAYSINLIPNKFRNIYAAYFIYDYVSSSNASIQEALLHCDLDTIQQQLSEIIEQNEEIIMELASLNASNQQIIAQNEQLMKHAIQTEHNSALCAQYQRISANNTRLIASIQTSNYLFK